MTTPRINYPTPRRLNLNGSHFLDRRGQSVNGCTVIEPVTAPGSVRWLLRCGHGHEFTAERSDVDNWFARQAGVVRCPQCRREQVVAPACCTICHRSGHNSRTCPERPESTRKGCGRCEGMSWRRPRRGACDCSERYAPEPPLTLDDILAQPREDRRVGTGGAW